eukprot:NODE_15346_length_1055_cov_3.011853.p1 GENE.NODE_15346_length_1055_cov_3.011853~~NODE_15346_length_1055_cov_3.011853.p1  ORF type:complete len:319 (-),score=111.81 NODE_15346_length_1055_cov_3.011853:97-1053(-)
MVKFVRKYLAIDDLEGAVTWLWQLVATRDGSMTLPWDLPTLVVRNNVWGEEHAAVRERIGAAFVDGRPAQKLALGVDLHALLLVLVNCAWAHLTDPQEAFLEFKDSEYLSAGVVGPLLARCDVETATNGREAVAGRLDTLHDMIWKFKFEALHNELPRDVWLKLQALHDMRLLAEWTLDVLTHSSTRLGIGLWSVPLSFFGVEKMSVELARGAGLKKIDWETGKVAKESRAKALQRLELLLKESLRVFIEAYTSMDAERGLRAEEFARRLSDRKPSDEEALAAVAREIWALAESAKQLLPGMPTAHSTELWAQFKAGC